MHVGTSRNCIGSKVSYSCYNSLWIIRLRRKPVSTKPLTLLATNKPSPSSVRDHRGTIRVTCGEGHVLSLGRLVLVGRSSPNLHEYFSLDLIAAFRSTSLQM
jgi:hypothetical protein